MTKSNMLQPSREHEDLQEQQETSPPLLFTMIWNSYSSISRTSNDSQGYVGTSRRLSPSQSSSFSYLASLQQSVDNGRSGSIMRPVILQSRRNYWQRDVVVAGGGEDAISVSSSFSRGQPQASQFAGTRGLLDDDPLSIFTTNLTRSHPHDVCSSSHHQHPGGKDESIFLISIIDEVLAIIDNDDDGENKEEDLLLPSQ